MTSALLDTRRRLLGLSIEELADVAGGVSPKTVNRWLNDLYPIPADVFDRVEALEARMWAMVDLVVERFGTASALPLIRYRNRAAYEASPDKTDLPFGAHAMMVGWAAGELEDRGCEVELIWAGAPEITPATA